MRFSGVVLAISALVAFQALASTSSTATALFGGSQTCYQSGPASASCAQTQGPDTVGSSATSNITTTSGLLDVVVNAMHSAGGFNNSPAGTAAASFSEILVVTGGSGSGILVANFFGFDDLAGSGPLPTAPVLMLQLGSTNSAYTPNGTPGSFSFSTPFTFGTDIDFDGSIGASAQAPFLMMNAASSANVEGKVTFTGFTLVGANGQPIGGTVVFTPEPSSLILVAMALTVFAVAVVRSRQARFTA
jgi:hypothetical protein